MVENNRNTRSTDISSQLWRKVPNYLNSHSVVTATAGPSFSFVYNGSTSSFMYLSPEATLILGWKREIITRQAIPDMLRRCHTEDKRSVMMALREASRYLRELDPSEEETIKFCLDFRLKVAEGNYRRILIDSTIYSGAGSKRNNWIGTVSDISYLKKEGKVSFRFKSKRKMVLLSDISKNQKSVGLFSSRERDILKLLAKGYSTQMIENTLHISQHTVRTHRRNMHKKCSVQNIAQLISLAIREGYI